MSSPSDIEKSAEEKDIIDTFFNSYTNFIDDCNKVYAQYAQAISNVGQEISDTWKKSAEAYATLTRAYMLNIYGPLKVPEGVNKGIRDAMDISNKINNISNKAAIAGFDIVRQNIKVFNDNIDSFTRLYTNLINTWSSITRKS